MLDKHDESDDALNWLHFGLPPSFETVNNRYAWMQFTGLHDKNGKDIYEGDVIDHYAMFGYVVYENGMFSLNTSASVQFNNCKQPLSYLGTQFIEVIGNIYENPELLTL